MYAVIYINSNCDYDYDYINDVEFKLFKSKDKADKLYDKLSKAGYNVFIKQESDLKLPIYKYHEIKYSLKERKEYSKIIKSINPQHGDYFPELKNGYYNCSIIRAYGKKKECRAKVDKFLKELPPYRMFNNMAIPESEIKDGIFEYNDYGVYRIDFNSNKKYQQTTDYYLEGVLQTGMIISGLDYTEVKKWGQYQNPRCSG